MTTAALIVAAGRGTRVGSAIPKQYAPLQGECALSRSLRAFLAHPQIGRVQVVINPQDGARYEAVASRWSGRIAPPVAGGATRQDSVRAGLQALKQASPKSVLIHDAARPFVSADLISRVLEALRAKAGAIAALPVTDTLKHAGGGGIIRGTVNRVGLWRAQTPQGFEFAAILDAHEAAHAAGRNDFPDDAAVAEWAGIDVALVMGDERNIKLTTTADLAVAAALAAGAAEPTVVRTGIGFDVHRFGEGDHLWLCGLRIAHTARLVGHSDADVALHALTDAILGAIGEGDIGEHFPPSDERWRNASSRTFLSDARGRVEARGGRLANVDITIMCQEPKIAPYREAMRKQIALVLGIDLDRVGIKATTTEGLGFVGRREGIAALATACVELPAGRTGEAPTAT
ncbi:MAG TPA: bifunctional 2-C-methyl-D-erythritol 4-phosphate cytidylyltransferase/2-C-methyl-D-erythritol 2,4-cyclodiphosphate synthase [Hyphomicrobiaceae bacterium]|nr:bifunctional 2-C-methyl-D-erythritol 4-phosphate cytidylyltransferase/2-C-methyl-D-erythritol 2,4-cyclodiphosphate synthase [Hyphomicrobiaceae bacterium]